MLLAAHVDEPTLGTGIQTATRLPRPADLLTRQLASSPIAIVSYVAMRKAVRMFRALGVSSRLTNASRRSNQANGRWGLCPYESCQPLVYLV